MLLSKYVFVFSLIALIFSSCGPKLQKEIISNWPDGSVQKVFFYKQNGDIREKVVEETYYQNGQKEMHGEFLNNKRHGLWTYWYEDGRKWSESEYENDLRVGKSIVWREKGILNYEGTYTKGKPHGKWTFYDVDGSRTKDVFFEHGVNTREHLYKEAVPFNLPTEDSIQVNIR